MGRSDAARAVIVMLAVGWPTANGMFVAQTSTTNHRAPTSGGQGKDWLASKIPAAVWKWIRYFKSCIVCLPHHIFSLQRTRLSQQSTDG